MKLSKTAFAIAALLGAVATAQAATINFTNITAAWFDPVGGDNPAAVITGADTSMTSADWGQRPNLPNSGYDFDTVGSTSIVVPPSPSPEFLLGTFTHRNFPILLADKLDNIKLRVTADIDVDGVDQGMKSFEFLFTHDETNNQLPAEQCKYQGPGFNEPPCEDAVDVEGLLTSESFSVGNVNYTIDFFGFRCDRCGEITNTFFTTEGRENSAGLYVVATATEVPEPSMLALVGVGLLGAAAARRRKA